MVSMSYETDVVAWANEQARLIRAGRFDLLDLEHLAEEIEDVGKSEQRELASRMAVLLAHLLKWQHQPDRHGNSWERTIRHQRERIALALQRTPSLKATLAATDWQREMWLDGIDQAERETGLNVFPESCPWPTANVLDPEFFPKDP
jgi:hypothetical protein